MGDNREHSEDSRAIGPIAFPVSKGKLLSEFGRLPNLDFYERRRKVEQSDAKIVRSNDR